MEDPFFVVKDEVFKALNKTRGLYLRWRELAASSPGPVDPSGTGNAETDWTTTELRNSLRSIEWDLEDLEDTIGIVEKNPGKFKIDKRELAARRKFIDATRDEVKSMKERMSLNRIRDRDITARQPLLDNSISLTNSIQHNTINCNLAMNSGGGGGSVGQVMSSNNRHSGTKYSKLENALDSPSHHHNRGGYGEMGLDSPSHRFLGQTVSTQQQLIQGQDEQLDVISDSIGTLKTVSRQINQELDEQAVMLDDFSHELGQTDSKLDSTMKKMAKLMHVTNDKRQWMAIGILSALLLIVILLLIIL